MSDFLEQRFAEIDGAARQEAAHARFLHETARDIAQAAASRWGAGEGVVQCGKWEGDQFHPMHLPPPNKHQQIEFVIAITLQEINRYGGQYCIPVSLRRTKQGAFATVKGRRQRLLTGRAWKANEYALLVDDLEEAFSQITSQIADTQILKD